MDKQALRTELRARRGARSETELAAWGLLLAAHAASLPGRTLTAFVGAGGEVPTLPLLDALVADGRRILLPITLDDMTLDWAEYTGAADLVPAAFGLLEPTGPRLGLDAIGEADVICLFLLRELETGGAAVRAAAEAAAGDCKHLHLHHACLTVSRDSGSGALLCAVARAAACDIG